jgi:hypothetical protein
MKCPLWRRDLSWEYQPEEGMGPTGSVAWERAMNIEEVILRAIAKRINWKHAAEIIGMSERQIATVEN